MVSDIRFYRVFGLVGATVALGATFAACAPFSATRDDAPPMDASRSDDPIVPAKALVEAGAAPAEAGATSSGDAGASSAADAAPAPKGCNGAVDCERVVFVTSETVWGSLINGVAGADQICNRLAAASKNPRIAGRAFIAWLSDDTRSPSTSFVKSTKPYVRPDGMRIASDYAHLTSGNDLESPIAIDEQGRQQSGAVWSATEPSGSHDGATCSGWSNPSGSGALGTITWNAAKWTWMPSSSDWTEVDTVGCSSSDSRIYCFER
jgi:hypothetical protein